MLALGYREPGPDPAGTSDEHYRGDAGLGKAHSGIDVQVPGSVGPEVASADIGNGRRARGADALAADDGPEGREWIRAPQRGRHRGLVGEDQPAHLHEEMTVAVEGAGRRSERPGQSATPYPPDRVGWAQIRAIDRRHPVELQEHGSTEVFRGAPQPLSRSPPTRPPGPRRLRRPTAS